MKKASVLIMVLSILSKIFGFIREATLAAVVGAGDISDAFVYSLSLPTTFFSVVIAAFATGLIPMYTRVENEEGSARAMRFLNNTLNIMLLFGVGAVAILFFFTEISLSVLMPSASAEALYYLVPFIKVTSFSILFTCIIQILTGFLHVKNSFLSVALLGFPLNIVLITAIYLTKSFGVDILPYAILIAYGVQTVLILGYAHFKGFRYKFTLDFKDEHTQKMIILALPLIVSSATSSLGVMVNNGLASSYEGGVTMLSFATRVGGMVDGIFGSAIMTVMYPSISKAISLGQHEKAKREFGESLISELIFILPATLGLLMLARPIINLVFVRGEFSMADAVILEPIMIAYSLGLVFYSTHNLLVRVFYSYQDMKTPRNISMGIIGIQIVLGVILSNLIGLTGIKLAGTIAFAIGVTIEFKLLMNKFKSFPTKKYGKQAVKILIATAIMGLAVLVCKLFLQTRLGNTTFLLITIIVAIGVYFMAILSLHVETFDDLIDAIRRKVKGL